MSSTLNLNCLVLGDDASHIFLIEIVENKTVGALKDTTRTKRSMPSHMSTQITSLPGRENLSKLDLVDDGLLLPVKTHQQPNLTTACSCELFGLGFIFFTDRVPYLPLQHLTEHH